MHNFETLIVIAGAWLLLMVLSYLVQLYVTKVSRRAIAAEWMQTSDDVKKASDAELKPIRDAMWFIRVSLTVIAVCTALVWLATMSNPLADGQVGDVEYVDPDNNFKPPTTEQVEAVNTALADKPGDDAMEDNKAANTQAMQEGISLFQKAGQEATNTNTNK